MPQNRSGRCGIDNWGTAYRVYAMIGLQRLTGICSVALLLLALPTAAGAQWAPGHYSHRDSNCLSVSNRVDPVTLVWYFDATIGRVASHVQSHMGWTNRDGSGQWFKVTDNPAYCVYTGGNGTNYQRASAGGSSTRSHVRYADDAFDNSAQWGYTVFGTPHYETYNYGPSCWGGQHAVSSPNGFITARNAIYNAFKNAGHTVAGYKDWGNTQQMKQCDGEYASNSDGRAYFIRVSSTSP